MPLSTYRQKRSFSTTPEPKGVIHKKGKTLRFVVQEHHASHIHWDFRLELDGVLKSWAIPKGPSMDPSQKHLAVMVEDHPYSYRTFHGVIPKGNYGAGTVTIWDEGTYEPFEPGDSNEASLHKGLRKGDLKIILHGKKLTGKFALIQFGKEEKNWLLIKEKDSVTPVVSSSLHGRKTSMPHNISPMLAEPAEKPFDSPDWVFEIKWDGYRAVSEITSKRIRLYSRNGIDFSKTYAVITQALRSISAEAIIDGEIVAVDKKGTPQFQLLQDYPKNPEVTLIYYVFDLLYLNGRDIRALPLITRKKLLKKILPKDPHLRFSDHIDAYGSQLFTLVKHNHIEGIMAKKKESPYISYRSSNWMKIKNILMQEAIICGFTEPNGKRKAFGALVLGVYNGKELQYIGHTGSGFDQARLQKLHTLLQPLRIKTCPFPQTPDTNMPVTWVKPILVCQVKFHEWTTSGVMRQSIFLGLRADKKATDVVREHVLSDSQSLKKGKVLLSNLEKVFWPKEGYTKGDVVAYYEKISAFILPYLKDRPQSLNRHPNGIAGESFYQKDMLSVPDWVKTIGLYSESERKTIHWLICNDRDTLLYMANLGCIEINPWSSRIQKKMHPDYLIIDLDPHGVAFGEVITTALVLKELMDRAKIESFIKTSGKTGLHILAPTGGQYTFTQVRQFAELLAGMASHLLPDTTSIVRNPQKREKKIYIDFLQNREGQTLAAPYSMRPVPQALVSTPLEWNELKSGFEPHDFTFKTIFKRLEKKGDLWKPFLRHKGFHMLTSLHLLQKK